MSRLAQMKRYELTYIPITEYHKQIAKGKVVSLKVAKVYKELSELINDTTSEWEYDSARANHAIEFIENYCRHSKGKFGGQHFVLELWQKALIAATFGIVHKIDRTRKFQEVLLVVGRKNGKSTLAAAIGLYMMVADGERGSEVYACGTKRDQAKIIWLEAKKMVKKSPSLLRRIKPLVGELVADFNDSSFKPLGSDSNTQDGLNVHCGLLDEIHAWKTKELYDVIVDGTSSREEPLIFITTTAGTIRESIYDIKYDEAVAIINGYGQKDGYKNERMLPIIYELDKREEWTDSECWAKANPGLGTIKQTNQLANKVAKAQENGMLIKNLVCKEFNIRETSTEAWLNFEDINNETMFSVEALKPQYGIGGVDLSSTTDLTAAKVIFQVRDDPRIYVRQMYWLPEDSLDRRVQEDKIPYDIWADLELLRLVPGNKVKGQYVTEWFKEIHHEEDIFLMYIGYDAWSATYWVDEMENEFGKIMVPVKQGKQTLSEPMKSLGADLQSKLIIYNNNPIDKWCLTNTSIDIDKNGNIQPIKGTNQRRRIDGAAALLDAYTVLQEKKIDYESMI